MGIQTSELPISVSMLYQLGLDEIWVDLCKTLHVKVWNNFWSTFMRIKTSDLPMLQPDNIPVNVYESRAVIVSISH